MVKTNSIYKNRTEKSGFLLYNDIGFYVGMCYNISYDFFMMKTEKKMSIYLDNAATTKPCREAVKAVTDCMTENYGNPSSLHTKG